MVEVCIVTLPGPDAPLQVAATERGLVAADWHPSEEAVLAGLRRRLGTLQVRPPTEPGPAAGRLHDALPILRALLAGRDAPVATIALDLADRPSFDQQVLAAVRDLGWGETASYGEIARRVGAPRAARAVGGALGRNPIALVIPCHRVVASDGTLGGYGGDGWLDRAQALERKRALLAREGVNVPMRER
jgi:methylated-DNA-[protein]-cysteine S-methyltransferase